MSQTQLSSAAFTAPLPQTLTVSGAGTGTGTVTSQAGLVPAINCTITAGVTSGACSQSYPWGTAVTLTGTGTGGSTFSGWSGACGGTRHLPGLDDAGARRHGGFTAPPQTLTVSGAGTGNGTVTSQAGLTPAINCTITAGVASGTCSQSYPFNTAVTLTAAATGGGTFSGWSGACSGTGSCGLTMSQARSVTAAFTGPAQTLTVAGAGGGQRHGDVAVGLAGDQLHDHQRRGVGDLLAELSDGQLGDARRDADGRRGVQRLVGGLRRSHRHLLGDDVAGAQRDGRLRHRRADAVLDDAGPRHAPPAARRSR